MGRGEAGPAGRGGRTEGCFCACSSWYILTARSSWLSPTCTAVQGLMGRSCETREAGTDAGARRPCRPIKEERKKKRPPPAHLAQPPLEGGHGAALVRLGAHHVHQVLLSGRSGRSRGRPTSAQAVGGGTTTFARPCAASAARRTQQAQQRSRHGGRPAGEPACQGAAPGCRGQAHPGSPQPGCNACKQGGQCGAAEGSLTVRAKTCCPSSTSSSSSPPFWPRSSCSACRPVRARESKREGCALGIPWRPALTAAAGKRLQKEASSRAGTLQHTATQHAPEGGPAQTANGSYSAAQRSTHGTHHAPEGGQREVGHGVRHGVQLQLGVRVAQALQLAPQPLPARAGRRVRRGVAGGGVSAAALVPAQANEPASVGAGMRGMWQAGEKQSFPPPPVVAQVAPLVENGHGPLVAGEHHYPPRGLDLRDL